MARRSRSTGVGRGNGAGSAKTQFQEGIPPPKGSGRKRKVKPIAPRTMSTSLEQALNALVEVTVNGEKSQMPVHQALVEDLLACLPRATIPQKLAVMRFLFTHVPTALDVPDPGLDPQGVEEVLAQLAEQERQRRAGLLPLPSSA